MIKLTLPDGSDFLINSDQISHIKAVDPAIIILKNGEEIKVKESYMTVINHMKATSYSNESITQ